MPPLDDIIMGRTELLLANGFPDGIPGMVKFLSDYPAQLEMLGCNSAAELAVWAGQLV